jgi:hypothetical protein
MEQLAHQVMQEIPETLVQQEEQENQEVMEHLDHQDLKDLL